MMGDDKRGWALSYHIPSFGGVGGGLLLHRFPVLSEQPLLLLRYRHVAVVEFDGIVRLAER